MSVALRGNLQDFGIADVFQLIGQQRKTGILEFTGAKGRVQLRFDQGAVVSAAPVGARAEEALGEMLARCGLLDHAEVVALDRECDASAQTVPRLAAARGWISQDDLERIEDLLTRETFFSVLRWETGEFDFRARDVTHQRRFESLLGAEQMLMDGLRMVDEWQTFAEVIPSEDVAYQKVAGFEEYRSRSQLEATQVEAAERVFQLIDGRISARRIIDLSMLGTFDAMRILADLKRADVIAPLAKEKQRQHRAVPRPSQTRPEQVRGWIAGLLPLVLLLSAVATALLGSSGGDEGPGLVLHRAPFEALRQNYAARGLRHALEAYRLADGRWPGALTDLAERGVIGAEALAHPEGRPYYYVEREDGAVLLAPER